MTLARGTLIEAQVFYSENCCEMWKTFRDRYLVSNLGRMCVGGKVDSFLEPRLHKSSGRPYFMVDGQVVYIHHAVLETFVSPRPTLAHHALHRDDDPLNNRVDNLYWGTQKENIADRARNNPGWSQPTPKLTEEQVREIRARDDASTKALAEEYGVAHSTMRKILRRETWRHVD